MCTIVFGHLVDAEDADSVGDLRVFAARFGVTDIDQWVDGHDEFGDAICLCGTDTDAVVRACGLVPEFDPFGVTPRRPRRVRRSRTAGWRMPRTAKAVGRPGRYGNPFTVVEVGTCWTVVSNGETVAGHDTRAAAHQDAVARFRQHAIDTDLDITPLRGYDLACWCPEHLACHADVLIDLANR